MYNNLNERDVETLIDGDLRNLGYIDDPKQHDKRNVFKQQPRKEEESKSLGSLRPDYVLYDSSFRPLAIIEAKKPHEDMAKAQEQGIRYAKKIKAPIVFVTDGIYTKSYHVKNKKPLYLNGDEVDDLLNQSVLEKFYNDNVYDAQEQKVINSRKELLSTFKEINNKLRDAGVASGLPRIDLFCNILFLKVISELHETDDNIVKRVPKNYLWDNFKDKKGIDLLDFINKQAFDYFQESYGGEVLSKIEMLKGKESILEYIIIEKLDNLWLSGTNTDIKGDAFEYFLRSYGGADTDFGEYFTPRHIVKMLVKLLNPQFGEKIYDPFCGTGGMLIESFKHIKRKMPQNDKTLNELKHETIYGGELTTMSRIAKMNMILAGDGHSNIIRQDSYQNKISKKYDVVITNIPFGSKMKTDYLKQYGYNGKSAELAGVLHCLEALSDSPNARAGIIVPEGILFNGSKGYTQLRKTLTEKYDLETIVSLPKGIFSDTGVKSNILIIKKKTEQKKKHTWYFDLKNDGFTLDKARTQIYGDSDIDVLLSNTQPDINELDNLKSIGFNVIHNEKMKKEKYVFLPNIYEELKLNTDYPVFKLSELEKSGDVSFLKGSGLLKSDIYQDGNNPCIHYGELYTLYKEVSIENVISRTNNQGKILSKTSDVLVPATTTADSMGIAIARSLEIKGVILGGDINIIRINSDKILPKYLSIALNYPLKKYLSKFAKGANILHLSNEDIKRLPLAIPPIKEQLKIIQKLEKDKKSIEDINKTIRKTQNKIEKNMNNIW